jgi:hypothetical protein
LKDCRPESPPISLVKRGIGGLLLIFFLHLIFSGCNRPQVTGIESDEIDASEDPSQTLLSSQEPVVVELKKGEMRLTPVAEYRIAALVVGKESYSYGWNAEVSPIDLALAWGKLAEPESRRYVFYSQSNRWTSFKMKEGSPFKPAYVTSHACNHHIIPSTRNLWYAIKTIKEKQRVVLEGFLVNVAGTYEGKAVWWKTSLSRTDSGDGACEILYVTKARIGNRVYE